MFKFEDENCIDTTQLMNSIEDHINLVLLIESKSDAMQYLLSKSSDIKQVEIIVSEFLSKTIPDLDSFYILLASLRKIDCEWDVKYNLANKFYCSFCEQESVEFKIEIGATLLFEFIDEFEGSTESISKILTDLHQRFPNNFPITVYFCKNGLLSGEYDESKVPKHREYLSTLTEAINNKQNKKELYKYKYTLHIAESEQNKEKSISICQYIVLARFVILQYFEKSGNCKFLTKTFEFSVKEIMSTFGAKESSKFIIRFIEEILLKKKLVSVKECLEFVQLITKVISKYALKTWITGHKEYSTSLYDKLLLFTNSFVFDSDQREDIEALIEDFK